jgi:type IV pilus assembly protein PilY1
MMKIFQTSMALLLAMSSLFMPSWAAELSLPGGPLFVAYQNHTPLVMLVMGRDHTLYYEAYNDASDVDHDKKPDTHFKPSIEYYGYFDSDKCYTVNNERTLFTPTMATHDGGKCGKPLWSGNFLNYLTTSRVDALRKVLYGGSRLDDADFNTPTLVRSFIPQDAHSWGKTWDPAIMDTVENGNLKASDYGDLNDENGYFFANTSLGYDQPPLLRVLKVSRNMKQIKEISFSHNIPSLYFSGTPNNWWFTAMTLVANNTWEVKVSFTGLAESGRTQRFKFTQYDNWNNQYGAKSRHWDGVTLVNKDGNNAPSDVPTPVVGDYYVTFNDQTNKFEIKAESSKSASSEEYDSKLYIWNWLSKERPVASSSMLNFDGNVETSGYLKDYQVKVRVCVAGLLERNCKKYGEHYLPTGLLQKRGEGENPEMEFGLISGSYKNNIQGGVLRANVGKMNQEIDSSTGLFTARSGGGGIIDTLNKIQITKFNFTEHKYGDNCGWITDGALTNGMCSSWGNPIGEMLFESLRYFAGAKSASPLFTVGGDDELGLVEAAWEDPFAVDGRKSCDIPVNLIISDINTSFDSDQVPGSAFDTSYSDTTFSDLDVAASTKYISGKENLDNNTFYIGDNQGTTGKDTPTAKIISDLGHIRGLAPQEPSKRGSYYMAGLAYYGHEHDLNKIATGDQKSRTFSVALASPLPEIKLDMGKKPGSTEINYITIIPFAKSVGGSGISNAVNDFQPTNTIVDYYIEKWTDTEARFRINFEDVEQGADHDMDMIVLYDFKVNGDQLIVTLTSEYAYGGIDQHAGYVISGTKKDGLYLDVEDQKDGDDSPVQVNYYLDTVAADDLPYPNNVRSNQNSPERDNLMPLTRQRTFTVDRNITAAQILRSPLWYAAKWGSFKEEKGKENGIPEGAEWDKDGDLEPDNFFLVTTASTLEAQLQKALNEVSKDPGSGNNMSYTSSQITSNSVVFDSKFEAKHWSGRLFAYPMVNNKTSSEPLWEANDRITAQGADHRVIFTMENDSNAGSKRVFTAPSSVAALVNGETNGLSKPQLDLLLTDIPSSLLAVDASELPTAKLNYLQAMVNYLRGSRANEITDSSDPTTTGYAFRQRDGILGDIVHSTPVYGVSAGDKQPFVIFGANDGMVHVLDASNGDELFAYIPSTSYKNLYRLSQETYDPNHRFFVDGGIKIVNITDGDVVRTIAVGTFGLGAQGAWALDLTNIKGLTATTTDANKVLLWELNDTDSSETSRVGYMMNAPAIISAASGASSKWVAIFGNGYNSSEADNAADSLGEGALLIVDLLTGNLEKTMLTGRGKAEDPMTTLKRPNGLTEPVIADKDLDGVGDTLYAGDLFGNVWKADIAGKSVSNWAFDSGTGSNPKPLFTAVSREGNSQPITQRPSVAYHPVEGLLVMVGTGKYIETTDVEVNNQATQTIYGLWDKPGRTADITRSTLLEQTITKEIAAPSDTSSTSNIKGQRETSKNMVDWTQHDGWYLDLYYGGKNSGERMNSRVVVRNTTAAFTTLIPSTDPCKGGGSGWYMEVGIYTGSNSYVDNNLVDHSALLDKIPSEPVVTFITNPKGDKEVINRVKINGGTPYESPGTTVNTGAISWQMLY